MSMRKVFNFDGLVIFLKGINVSLQNDTTHMYNANVQNKKLGTYDSHNLFMIIMFLVMFFILLLIIFLVGIIFVFIRGLF